MRGLIFLVTLSMCSGCGLELPQLLEGDLTSDDGTSCRIDLQTSVGFGFCLESENVFSASGNGDCGDATVWLASDALAGDGEFVLNDTSTSPLTGEGAVWVTLGEENYVSSTGTATLTQTGQTVSVFFDADLVTFIGGEAGPHASGEVLCDLAD